MMRDPGDIARERLSDLLSRLRLGVDDPGRSRQVAFDEILNGYEGYDIVEVICREAEFWLFSSLLENGRIRLEDAKVMSAYYEELPKAAEKYANSESWPCTETRRARSFFLQLTALAPKPEG